MTRNLESVEVITRDQRRRRWTTAEKAALVRKTYEPGMSVSLVARTHTPRESVESEFGEAAGAGTAFLCAIGC